MVNKKYNPETYWSAVGQRIQERSDSDGFIAGDDEPFYRYKRQKFIKLLRGVNFNGKKVLEMGCGPGGNLVEIHNNFNAYITGVDVSQTMVDLALKNIPETIQVHNINGTELPFENSSFDIVFTTTVLQDKTNNNSLKKLLREICRVSDCHLRELKRKLREMNCA